MDLETLIPIIGGLVALGSFVLAVVEYQRQGALKRAEHFFVMRKSYREDSDFQKISDLLEDDSQELKKIPYADKRRFLGFYEEIALMMNSGLVRKELAHYMFGYDAIRCLESEHFWVGAAPDLDSKYWILFNTFAKQMKEVEGSPTSFDPKEYKF
ncbi:MAG: hypothetical protein CL607_09490 [Anaerolineaceae bacterium]|mgnify:CR=1 FL=1|nr:hypothetical protein [Anaerolineaceae bacterium]